MNDPYNIWWYAIVIYFVMLGFGAALFGAPPSGMPDTIAFQYDLSRDVHFGSSATGISTLTWIDSQHGYQGTLITGVRALAVPTGDDSPTTISLLNTRGTVLYALSGAGVINSDGHLVAADDVLSVAVGISAYVIPAPPSLLGDTGVDLAAVTAVAIAAVGFVSGVAVGGSVAFLILRRGLRLAARSLS